MHSVNPSSILSHHLSHVLNIVERIENLTLNPNPNPNPTPNPTPDPDLLQVFHTVGWILIRTGKRWLNGWKRVRCSCCVP
jgi:hypothetical protein